MTLTQDVFLPRLTPSQTAEVTRLIGELDEFKGHWRRLSEINAERLNDLRAVTTIESTASSTRIEGAELSDAQVALVLQGLSLDSFRERDEAEVRGYRDLLEMIYTNWEDLSLRENHIWQLHTILLKYSEKDERHRGGYKHLDNHVEATHADGRKEIVFRTASPFETPFRMADLCAATVEAFEREEVHPLIVIARFIVDFLAIHPFEDGNGRLSRGLTTLLMLKGKYDYVPYSSLERIIEENKAGYYTALRESQRAMVARPDEFGTWLLFFLNALRAQKRALEAKVDVERSMRQLSETQERILGAVTAGTITSTQIATRLSIPWRTVRYHLDILVKEGLIEAHGKNRGRSYTKALVPGAKITLSDPGTNGIIAEIYERGKRIRKPDLLKLVKKYGYDGRVVGILHGRRVAHLRRDTKSGDSILTSRGEEVARQHLFSLRLVSGRADVPDAG